MPKESCRRKDSGRIFTTHTTGSWQFPTDIVGRLRLCVVVLGRILPFLGRSSFLQSDLKKGEGKWKTSKSSLKSLTNSRRRSSIHGALLLGRLLVK